MFRRAMAFAGSWYPADRKACERHILEAWREPVPEPLAGAHLGVAPHAGWVFSGRLAARVFQALVPASEVDLVIVLGGHLHETDPVIAMVEGTWETPFGELTLHEGFRAELETLSGVVIESERRAYADNSTELQLPLVKYKYPQAEALVLRVPPAGVALEVGRVLADYLERTGLRAVAVASTDLTHYGPNYRFEPKGSGPQALAWVKQENDPAFIEALGTVSGQRVLEVARRRTCACSAGAVAAVTEVARRQGRRFGPLAYTTSADIAPRDLRNFVGYLAGVFV